MSSFSIHLSNPLLTLQRAPITTGTTCTFLISHILPISLFKSLYFSTFFYSFSFTLLLAGTAMSTIRQTLSFLSITAVSGLPCFDRIVTLYIYVAEKFDFVIFYGTFWNVVIPFFTVFKVMSLAQIPMKLF